MNSRLSTLNILRNGELQVRASWHEYPDFFMQLLSVNHCVCWYNKLNAQYYLSIFSIVLKTIAGIFWCSGSEINAV